MAFSVIKSKISSIIDTSYLLRFLFLLLILYYGNLAFIAIIDPRGAVYSPFLDNHLNYINWLRNSYLIVSSQLAHLAGYHTHPTFPYRLSSDTGRYVEMVYDCLGIGFLSFWTAFVWANNSNKTNRLVWWLLGLFSIWLINCVRVAILLIAVINHWQYNRYMDHHTLFNLCAYALIGGFIIMYTRQIEKKPGYNSTLSVVSP